MKRNPEYNKQYRLKHNEHKRQYNKQYYLKHLVEIRNYKKQYYLEHLAEIRNYTKQYNKQYYLEHLEKMRNYNKQYNKQWRENNREKYLESRKKVQNKRKRNLGFEPLNKPQEGFVAHHLNFKKVIYIPKELHQSISHNVFTGKNMHIINALAMDYWEIPE